jgi:hypothetical protein
MNRRSFWVYLPPSYASPPPRDEAHLHAFLVAHLARQLVPLPQVVQLQRNQALGEKPGFHGVGMFSVGLDGLRVLRSYPGIRGVPHAPPARDFWFKRGSLREFASGLKLRPAEPASWARVGEIEGPEASRPGGTPATPRLAALAPSVPLARIRPSAPSARIAASAPRVRFG